MQDPQGRWIVYGWLPERREEHMQRASGWSGVMSHPRILSTYDGHVVQYPAPELERLRDTHHSWHDQPLEHLELGMFGPSVELKLRVRTTTTLTLSVGDAAQICVDVDGLHVSTAFGVRHLALPKHESLELHVFVDASVLEVFAHGRAITRRISAETLPALTLNATPGTHLKQLDVWTQRTIWNQD
jgi:beta-fructofuranosidase